MEGTEVGIFIKAPAWIHLFLLKIKIQQNPSYPRKEHNTIFKHIHQNIRAYPRSKKICIDQWLWKYYCILRKIWVKRGVGKQVWFVPNTFLAGSKGSCHPRNVLRFLLLFKLGSSIPSTLTKKKMLFKHEHFFLLKTGNLILNRVPISPTNIPCLRLSSQSDKYEIKEASRIQIYKLISKLVAIWDYRFLFFELGKIEKSSQSNIQKCPKISLWIK